MKTLTNILFGCLIGWCIGMWTYYFMNQKSTPKSSSEGSRVSLTMDDVLVIYENGWVRGEKSGLFEKNTWAQDSAFITETLWGSFHEDNKVFMNNKRVD